MKFSTGAAALALLATQSIASPTSGKGHNKRPKGFPYADGEHFKLDGKPFLFAGSNAYWFPFINVSLPSNWHLQILTYRQSPPDVKIAMETAVKAGQKVIRTWAFNDKNETFVPGGLPQYGGEGA